jgi:hypothetical protein
MKDGLLTADNDKGSLFSFGFLVLVSPSYGSNSLKIGQFYADLIDKSYSQK